MLNGKQFVASRAKQQADVGVREHETQKENEEEMQEAMGKAASNSGCENWKGLCCENVLLACLSHESFGLCF